MASPRGRSGQLGFDPGSPTAARWRAFLRDGLTARGVPPDVRLELGLRPACEAPVTRMTLDAWWSAGNTEQHARGESIVPIRRLRGSGWPGWPAYLSTVRLLRALD